MNIWSTEIKELEKLYDSFKGHFPDIEKELERLIKADDENMVLLYSRRCLEVIITELCECELKRPRKTEPLKGIIDKLNREEKVPSHIIASMLNLNSLSTFGAHPKEYDPQQVRLVLINLTTIINWYLHYKTEKVVSPEKEKVEENEIEKPDDREKPVHVYKSKKTQIIIIPGILLMSAIIIFALDIFNIFRKDKFEDIRNPEGKISIAVMPFENLTGDSALYFWVSGISEYLINGLGNSEELAVLSSRVISEVIESTGKIQTASISPSLARETARKVKAGTYITGNFIGSGDNLSIMVNLVNTENGEVIWSNKVDGDLENHYRHLLDSLSDLVKNFLEIIVLEENADYDLADAYPNSAQAYRHYLDGLNSIVTMDYESAIQSLLKAIEIDSNFTFATFYLAWAYWDTEQWDQANYWIKKSYGLKHNLPLKYHPWIDLWYACAISKNRSDIIKCCNLLEKSGINSRFFWYDLAVTYSGFLQEYEKAISAFEKVMELSLEWGGYWEYDNYYRFYGLALYEAGRYEKEKEINDIGLSINPENGWCIYHQAICDILRGDTLAAEKNIGELKSLMREYNFSGALIEHWTGNVFYYAKDSIKAEKHYRNAYNLDENNAWRIFYLARVLINREMNLDEGMELLQKALEIEPDISDFLWLKGRGYYKSGNYEEALRLFEKIKVDLAFSKSLQEDIVKAEQALANQNK